MITTLILFILILLVLVIAHECGHFFSARAFGIRVDEFGFGFPPRIAGYQGKKTLFSLNWLLLGGFVKIFGEDDGKTGGRENFGDRSTLVRSVVLLSGVLANIVLAYIIISAITMIGIPAPVDDADAYIYPDVRVMVLDVAPQSPASVAGIRAGDDILEMKSLGDVLAPKTSSEVQAFIATHLQEPVTVIFLRGSDRLEIAVTPRKNPPEGEGAIGVSISAVHLEKAAWYRAPIVGAQLTWETISRIGTGLKELVGELFRGNVADVQVAGPIGIYDLVGNARASGIVSFLFFVALLSLNLAFVNLLPFPGLDGGRFLFVMVEVVSGRRLSGRASSITNMLGFILLVLLMLVISFLDIRRKF